MTATTGQAAPRRIAQTTECIGFIGLGVMGSGMCRNLMRRAPDARFVAHDPRPEAMAPVVAAGAAAAAGVAEVAARADIILLSLPDGDAVAAVLAQMADSLRPGQIIIDTSTSPVDRTRDFAALVAQRGAAWLDAPIARTREAAENGTLSIMVGGAAEHLARVWPILECMGTDISHCGPVGSGQTVKILNNMVLFQTVNALSEALAVATAAGVPGEVLFSVLSKGSADSFALRNHGMKALLPGAFPSRAFSTAYARKDNEYALRLAGQVGVDPAGARLLAAIFEQAEQAGLSDHYFPVFHLLHRPD